MLQRTRSSCRPLCFTLTFTLWAEVLAVLVAPWRGAAA